MTVLPRSFVRVRTRALGALGLAAVLGIAACTESTEPVRRYAVLADIGQSDWQTVSVGSDHTCGIKASGDAYCWGDNEFGQLGVARTDTVCGQSVPQLPCSLTPVQVSPGTHFTAISAGSHHTCAITTDRLAYCWGNNDQGQVSAFTPGGFSPIIVPGAFGWTQISAGSTHTCAVRTDGALFCWGGNARGELGNGRTANSLGILRVTMPAAVASVSAGQERTCARTIAGVVYCWGAVWVSRQDGLEFTRQQLSPQLVPNAPPMAWLSVGTFTTCGTDLAGVGYCWEGNPRGEMGTGIDSGSTVPQPVATGVSFVHVSAGIVNSCGVSTTGAGYCWGDDTFGQLGVSPSALTEVCGGQRLACSTRPRAMFGQQRFVEIATGFGSHACGVTTQHNLYCWGLGVSGQRGDGTANYATSIPIMVAAAKTQ